MPHDGSPPEVGAIRVRAPTGRTAWRTVLVSLHLAWGMALATWVGVSFGRIAPEAHARRWYGRLLQILGVRVHWTGTPDSHARLIVANHISWLDIVVIGARCDARFVAKQEVRDWPLIGWLAQAAGAFFIRRGSCGAKPLLERVYPHMTGGGSLAIFPEGTTTDGSELRPFHARLFEAALSAGTQVQPIALRYHPAADGSAVAPFVGDDDFIRHLWRVLREPMLQVEAVALDPLPTAETRDTLATAARSAIAGALQLPLHRPDRNADPAPALRRGALTR